VGKLAEETSSTLAPTEIDLFSSKEVWQGEFELPLSAEAQLAAAIQKNAEFVKRELI
jgi:hypothetical protein